MNNKFLDCPFEMKSIDEKGMFEGYASDYINKKDSYGDIIMPGAFTETLKKGGRNGGAIPMLWQHKSDEPIGIYKEITEKNNRLHVIGELALGVKRADEAYILMKQGAVRGLSIGWDVMRDDEGTPVENAYELDNKKGIRYLKQIELWEISPATFPANTRATITSVKSAIENAKDVRELEKALCEEGLSHSAAKYIASICKKQFEKFKDDRVDSDKILEAILQIKNQIKYESKPNPVGGESRSDFMSRCMSQTMKDHPGMENDQAVAICMTKWEKR